MYGIDITPDMFISLDQWNRIKDPDINVLISGHQNFGKEVRKPQWGKKRKACSTNNASLTHVWM